MVNGLKIRRVKRVYVWIQGTGKDVVSAVSARM